MKKLWILLMISVLVLAACKTSGSPGGSGGGNGDKDKESLTMVWYPNESGKELKGAREEIGKIIEEETGKKVKHKLTTDYTVAIETLTNNKADLAFMGAEGYIQAKEKNKAIEPLVVASGPSGTTKDAKYNSWLATKPENMKDYETETGKYSLDNIENKKMSFVSPSSTSGFLVPSTLIANHFKKQEEFKDLKPKDLSEGGNLLKETMFGNTHQGSAVNLLNGKADIAAFSDINVADYVEVDKGEANKPGTTYKVKEDAKAPFTQYKGKKFGIIKSTPVLNAPIVGNSETLDKETMDKIKEKLTSKEISNNKAVFLPEDEEGSGLFEKTDKEQFVEVEDKWFDPIRNLSDE